MTIVDALKEVLSEYPNGLTSKRSYEEIVKKNLYDFPAKKPQYVVNGIIRRHCYGLDFPTANPIKYFKIVSYIEKKPVYALLLMEKESAEQLESKKKDIDNERLPEEKIQDFYEEHLNGIYSLMFDNILNRTPSFFENLVVELLLKMGYGYDDNSGVVVGGSHDSGIDGIINEDKLGLDLIYLQAKRYGSKNKVGRPELQAFVGAMQNIHKGVFITTSGFTKECIQYVMTQQQKNIKLIDGKMLTKFMVKYEVGVVCEQSIKIYKIDTSYFD